MKKFFNLSCLFLLSTTYLCAQNTEVIRVKGDTASDFITKTQFKFPAFTRANVYLKNGEVASGRFNYDYFQQAMEYIGEKKETLALANEEDVKYISFGQDTFFYDNKFYEWIASSPAARLAVRYVYKLADKEKVGAYGISSSTNNIESHNAILDVTSHQLAADEVLVFSKQTIFYISAINGHFAEANKKNISKLYPHKKIEDYITDHKLNLNKADDLVDVFIYASTP